MANERPHFRANRLRLAAFRNGGGLSPITCVLSCAPPGDGRQPERAIPDGLGPCAAWGTWGSGDERGHKRSGYTNARSGGRETGSRATRFRAFLVPVYWGAGLCAVRAAFTLVAILVEVSRCGRY